jgi:hypothetical protein
MKSAKRVTSALAITALLPLMIGCFGSFGLTKKVYHFNSEFSSEKWPREGIFLLLNFPFVPIYGGAAFLDTIFFNSVEFWTGEKLIADSNTPQARTTQEPAPAASVRPSSAPSGTKPKHSTATHK